MKHKPTAKLSAEIFRPKYVKMTIRIPAEVNKGIERIYSLINGKIPISRNTIGIVALKHIIAEYEKDPIEFVQRMVSIK